MTSIYGKVVPGGGRIRYQDVQLGREARVRLSWFDFYERNGRNASLVCRRFGSWGQTFYRWKRRYNPGNLRTLEERSRRPRRVRQPFRATQGYT